MVASIQLPAAAADLVISELSPALKSAALLPSVVPINARRVTEVFMGKMVCPHKHMGKENLIGLCQLFPKMALPYTFTRAREGGCG